MSVKQLWVVVYIVALVSRHANCVFSSTTLYCRLWAAWLHVFLYCPINGKIFCGKWYCIFMYLHRACWHSSATVCVCVWGGGGVCVFVCVWVSACASCVRVRMRVCVLYYCHRVATQMQLTNISYHIPSQKIEELNYTVPKTLNRAQ